MSMMTAKEYEHAVEHLRKLPNLRASGDFDDELLPAFLLQILNHVSSIATQSTQTLKAAQDANKLSAQLLTAAEKTARQTELTAQNTAAIAQSNASEAQALSAIAQSSAASSQSLSQISQSTSATAQGVSAIAQSSATTAQNTTSIAQSEVTEIQKLEAIAQNTAASSQSLSQIAQSDAAEIQALNAIATNTAQTAKNTTEINTKTVPASTPATPNNPTVTIPSATVLTLQNNWSADTDGAVPGYRKLASGLVEVKGLVKKSLTLAVNEAIATLPAGFRPSERRIFPTVGKNALGALTLSTLDVLPTGEIRWLGGVGLSLSLDSIRFVVES